MSTYQVCPRCSQVNPDQSVFCARCGYRFQNADALGAERSQQGNIPGGGNPSIPAGVGTVPAQADYVMGGNPSAPPFPGTMPAQPPAGQYPPQGQYPPMGVQGAYNPPPPPVGQVPGTVSGTASLQRAFAGRGTAIHHYSWLIDGKQVPPVTLRNAIIDAVNQQGIMGVTASLDRLREHDVLMEERDYVRIQRGTSSVFVYVAPFGHNLYISRTSVVQQALSRVRIGVLGGLFVLMLIFFILAIAINPSITDVINNPNGAEFAATIHSWFSLLSEGLFLFFIILLVRSFILWLTEKDFFVYLRPNVLNDFTVDAVSLLEHLADRSVREAARQSGLSADELPAPAQEYQLKRPLHLI